MAAAAAVCGTARTRTTCILKQKVKVKVKKFFFGCSVEKEDRKRDPKQDEEKFCHNLT